MKTIKNKSPLILALLSTILISNCGGPNIESIKEPVLGTEKHKLSGYGFYNRGKSVGADLVLSCTPNSKNNTTLNGTLYIGSLSNEYTFDEKVKLFLEINGIRKQLNVVNRTQSTGELGKNFFKSTRSYITRKSIAFEINAQYLNEITPTSNLKLILTREIGTSTKEDADILTLFPDEFDSKHFKTIDDFRQKCKLPVKI